METQKTFLLVLFHLIQFCLASSHDLNMSSTDEHSLLAIKSHIITSDSSQNLSHNWSVGTDFCTWIGVTCSRRQQQRVTVINLFNMSLEGTIAKEIGNLSFLLYFNIAYNSFNGVIPYEMGNLRRLRRLEMSYNQLSGQIPLSFGFLTNLTRLGIQVNRLSGTIPREIFNISSLETLALVENQLYGTLPDDMCYKLPKLEALYLASNLLSGGIPTSLPACSQLNTLTLANNNFSGDIPWMGNSSQLQILQLGSNNFSGTLLASVGNLSNLRNLDLADNNIQGEIPREFGQFFNLRSLTLQLNNLNGAVPESIFNLSGLLALSLAGNALSGKLPFSINSGLPNIGTLYLGTNNFSGRIPSSISNISSLFQLDLSSNSFTGRVPISLGNLNDLQTLNFAQNFFTNDLSTHEQDFITPLTRCGSLKNLVFSSNLFTGLLPKSIGNMSSSLEIFSAYSSTFSGQVPDEIGNMSSLIFLDLSENKFIGMFPSTLGQLRKLQSLEINDNKLHGSIPDSFCNLTNLYHARLSDNRLSGPLPTCIGNLVSLRELYIANNAFTSSIPPSLWSNNRITIMNFSNNLLDGSLTFETGNLRGLTLLDLSGNQLSGEIPTTFQQLESLNSLVLSNNKLQGPIPDIFDNVRDLQYLDLSQNNISGEIPMSLETLTHLSYFNVSFNDLRGEIPNGGSFVNFTMDSFLGNHGLCGASRFNFTTCSKPSKHKSSWKKNMFIRYIMPPIVSIAFAAIIMILFLRYRARKSLKLPSSTNLSPVLTHERVSYYELLRATNNLDEGNLIGKGSIGSVYKGIFDNGKIAAVKVFDLDVQGAIKSFDVECQILRSIRHKNLVKVITSCSNLEFKALVLEYMPKGNLDQWLYSESYFLSTDQRLGIMVDIASAIEYLHRDYSSPIVHCDLKPSNILLDEDMVARVGDFGIAKLLTQDQRIEQTKTLGTIGYMAPEYGSGGLVSTSIDVYSYGILLMETFTRKKPTDDMFLEELTLRSWIFGSIPNGIKAIVDVDLLTANTKREMLLTLILELALECTVDSPEKRLNMKDVLLRLKKIQNEFQEMKVVT